MLMVFYGFTFCNTLSKIYVSGFASWQIQMNIYVSVLLCMLHLVSNISVSGSLSDFGMLSEVVLDLC